MKIIRTSSRRLGDPATDYSANGFIHNLCDSGRRLDNSATNKTDLFLVSIESNAMSNAENAMRETQWMN